MIFGKGMVIDMDEALHNLVPVFADMELKLRGFKKDTYSTLFSEYMEKNHDFFHALNQILVSDEDKSIYHELANHIIEYAEKMLKQSEGKIKKESIQLNLNMFMAIYFLPAILEGKQTNAQEFADIVCEKWAVKFKGSNIQNADFASIQSGFKSKLCYVTTAVCKSLNKPEDCYELKLLKDYRDQYLAGTDNGAELIQRYYDIAPTIVKRIDKSENAEEKYSYIWERYLKPCIAYIEHDKKEECGKTYIRMIEELQDQYVITSKEEKKLLQD